jgi:hypothetical protein
MAHADPKRFLGGADVRDEWRSNEEIASVLAGISKQARSTLDTNQLNKLKESATKGLSTPFKVMDRLEVDLTDTSKLTPENLKKIYSVTIRIEELWAEMRQYDMVDMFETGIPTQMVFSPEENMYVPAIGSTSVNLFESYAEVDIETVRRASKWAMRKSSETYTVQNLTWSMKKVLNSCEDDLRQKIEEELFNFPIDERTGPVAFKLMATHVLAVTEGSIRALEKALEQMALTDFDGENVKQFVSVARGLLMQLSNNRAVPKDVVTLLTNGLRKCSTEEFVGFVGSLMTLHSQELQTLTYSTLLSKVEAEYNRLLGKVDGWKRLLQLWF